MDHIEPSPPSSSVHAAPRSVDVNRPPSTEPANAIPSSGNAGDTARVVMKAPASPWLAGCQDAPPSSERRIPRSPAATNNTPVSGCAATSQSETVSGPALSSAHEPPARDVREMPSFLVATKTASPASKTAGATACTPGLLLPDVIFRQVLPESVERKTPPSPAAMKMVAPSLETVRPRTASWTAARPRVTSLQE